MASRPDQEVKITAQVRLLHMIGVEPLVAGRHGRLWGAPAGTATVQFGLGKVELQPPAGDIELDLVTVLDQGQGSAGGGFGITFPYARVLSASGRFTRPRSGLSSKPQVLDLRFLHNRIKEF